MNKKIIFSAKEYKVKYNSLLESYLLEYEDFEEIDFINIEIESYKEYIGILDELERKINNTSDYELNSGHIESLLETFDYLEFEDCIDYNKRARSVLSFNKIIKFLEPKKEQLTTQPQQLVTKQINTLNWQGTPLQFAELTKALIETKLISPELTQNEFFKRMKLFFNIDEFDESDKLKDIRKRTNTTTPLLNILENSLNNWIKSKD